MDMPDWPRPPIRPEDLPKIRELLNADDYEKLLKRLSRPQSGHLIKARAFNYSFFLLTPKLHPQGVMVTDPEGNGPAG